MGVTIALAMSLAAASGSDSHVRSSDPRIAALLARGIERSQTVRQLVFKLNRSDVIVYLEPKHAREALGGYLSHHIVTNAGVRYLRAHVETQGADARLIPLMAHELQHAVEVAQAPDARDSESLERLFARLNTSFGCDSTNGYETSAAKAIEHAVREEIRKELGDRHTRRVARAEPHE